MVSNQLNSLNENTQKLAAESDDSLSDQSAFKSVGKSVGFLPETSEMTKFVRECAYEVPEAAGGKDVFTCRAALWGLMFITSMAGMVSVFLHHKKHYVEPLELSELKRNFFKSQIEVERGGAGNMEQGRYSANIDKIAGLCSRMVNTKNSFAIFENGTCVLVFEPTQDHVVSAKSSLQILADPNMSFHVKPMNNNNYLVIFNKYIFCWLFAEDIAKAKVAIIEDSRLNVDRPSDNAKVVMSPFERRLGRLARLLLIKDSEDLELKELIRLDSGQQVISPFMGSPVKNNASGYELDSVYESAK